MIARYEEACCTVPMSGSLRPADRGVRGALAGRQRRRIVMRPEGWRLMLFLSRFYK